MNEQEGMRGGRAAFWGIQPEKSKKRAEIAGTKKLCCTDSGLFPQLV